MQHESFVPLYIQIKELLQTQIEAGEYAVGDRLPSERELAQQYDVSRMTARQALLALAQDGLTYSRVGKGTFVRAPKINHELRDLNYFSRDMRERGLTPSSRVLAAEVRPVEPDIALRLKIAAGTLIVLLRRVRLAGGQPLALETTHIPHGLCLGLLDGHDFSHESLYEVLQCEYGWVLAWADQVIETRLPDEFECRVLDLDRKTPVLRFTRVTYDDQERPVEFVRSVYRGDRYQLRATLRYS